jgi:hypothetical protein
MFETKFSPTIVSCITVFSASWQKLPFDTPQHCLPMHATGSRRLSQYQAHTHTHTQRPCQTQQIQPHHLNVHAERSKSNFRLQDPRQSSSLRMCWKPPVVRNIPPWGERVRVKRQHHLRRVWRRESFSCKRPEVSVAQALRLHVGREAIGGQVRVARQHHVQLERIIQSTFQETRQLKQAVRKTHYIQTRTLNNNYDLKAKHRRGYVFWASST